MPKPEAAILRPITEEELVESINAMCTNMDIGCIALGTEIDFVNNDDAFFELLAQGIPGNYELATVGHIMSFDAGHGWHLPRMREQPMLRLWHHVKGQARFGVARALPEARPGYFTDLVVGPSAISEIASEAYTSPAFITPESGETLVFVDMGSKATGTSAIHGVSVLSQGWYNTRLSLARDVRFEPPEES